MMTMIQAAPGELPKMIMKEPKNAGLKTEF